MKASLRVVFILLSLFTVFNLAACDGSHSNEDDRDRTGMSSDREQERDDDDKENQDDDRDDDDNREKDQKDDEED